MRVCKHERDTFDRDVDGLELVRAVKLREVAERKGVVLGWREVVSGRLHDGLERALVVGLCGDSGSRWGTRRRAATVEIEQWEYEQERVDVIGHWVYGNCRRH